MKKIKYMGILDVLIREFECSPKVYLYEEDGRWYAYEHSAVLISRIYKNLVTIKMYVNSAYEIALQKVEIDLDLVISNSLILSCSDDELIVTYDNELLTDAA